MNTPYNEHMPWKMKAFLCLVSIVILAFAGLQFFAIGLTNDTINLLFYAKHLMHDGMLYDYWVEVNPPLIFLLYLLPVWILEHTPITPAMALNGSALLLICLSLMIHVAQLRHYKKLRKICMMHVLLHAWVLVVMPAMMSVFADREHLLFVFIMPFMIARLQKQKPSIAACIFAGIGFCIKPYNALIFFALACIPLDTKQQLLSRLLSKENITVVAVAVVYLLIVAMFFPGYFSLLPDAMLTYREISHPFINKLPVISWASGLFLILCVSSTFPMKSYWIILWSACVAVYCLNGGWQYMSYILVAPLVYIYGYWLFIYDSTQKIHRLPRLVNNIFVALVLGVFLCISLSYAIMDVEETSQTGHAANYHVIPEARLTEIREAVGGQFILLSTTIWSSNIADLKSTPTHVFGYDYLGPLPWVKAHAEDPRASVIASKMQASFLQSLQRFPQAAILVDVSPVHRGIEGDAELLAFFTANAEVKHALREYRLVKHINFCAEIDKIKARCAYDIWLRNKSL